MKKFLLVIGLIIVVIVWFFGSGKNEEGLVGPNFIQHLAHIPPTPTVPAPTPNAPKTFSFDSSTDLKVELEKVNPQILDSDFDDLKSLTD